VFTGPPRAVDKTGRTQGVAQWYNIYPRFHSPEWHKQTKNNKKKKKRKGKEKPGKQVNPQPKDKAG
jgi:hypothetical protein